MWIHSNQEAEFNQMPNTRNYLEASPLIFRFIIFSQASSKLISALPLTALSFPKVIHMSMIITNEGKESGDRGHQEPRCRPTSDAKARELNGSNIFGYPHQEYHPPSRGSYQELEDHRFPPRQSSSNNIVCNSLGPQEF